MGHVKGGTGAHYADAWTWTSRAPHVVPDLTSSPISRMALLARALLIRTIVLIDAPASGNANFPDKGARKASCSRYYVSLRCIGVSVSYCALKRWRRGWPRLRNIRLSDSWL
jgi:hypothetical protein